MQFYNSLSRKKEPFQPQIPGKVGLYACGITAYDYCHIGHARSAVVFDVLVRYLRSQGLEVKFVRNFTDVDDKIITKANQEGITSNAVAQKYIKAFHEDMDKLKVLRASSEPKATEYIGEMIELCKKLIAQDNAYATPSGDVYFRVRSFPEYGKLSGRDVNDMRAGSRILPGEEKEDPLDFALWKSAKPDEPFWESPWGNGRPGWHIECSAMSEKELPLPLDIHGGGQDLIFPHHENEIAQTEAATGKSLARYWIHNGFVQVDSQKMSKSLGNFRTIRDILQNYLPQTLRFFLLGRHYHSPIDFTVEAMDDAEKNLKRIYESLSLLSAEIQKTAPKPAPTNKDLQELKNEVDSLIKDWDNAMADDMNTAAALGHINALMHIVNKIIDDKILRKSFGIREILATIEAQISRWEAILGVLGDNPQTFLDELRECRLKRHGLDKEQIETLMQKRLEARKSKDFALSDALRDDLSKLGVTVRDTPDGAVWDIS